MSDTIQYGEFEVEVGSPLYDRLVVEDPTFDAEGAEAAPAKSKRGRKSDAEGAELE